MSQVASSGPHIEVREQPQLSDVPYILGHSNAELRRLMLQAAILKPITQRNLRTRQFDRSGSRRRPPSPSPLP